MRHDSHQDYPGSLRVKKSRLSPARFLLLAFAGLFLAAWLLLPLFTPDDTSIPQNAHAIPTLNEKPKAQNARTLLPSPAQTARSLASADGAPSAAPTHTAEETPAAVLLVNAQNPLPADYRPEGLVLLNEIETELFSVKNAGTYASRTALEALTRMLQAAHQDGLKAWQISEAYRSIADQQKIWDAKYKKYREVNGLSEKKALQAVARRVAKPGCIEHHTGLALDITVPGESFRLTKQAKWLEAHCHEYGFVIRYTEEKERITGITAEPWHIRYVGLEAAEIMTRENLCLEEYVQKYQ